MGLCCCPVVSVAPEESKLGLVIGGGTLTYKKGP